MFQAVYASKIFKASSRKDKILAAFNNPINSELVDQLASALDEEYQQPDLLIRNYDKWKERAESTSPEGSSDDVVDESEDFSSDINHSTPPSHSSPSGPDTPDSLADEVSDEVTSENVSDSSTNSDSGTGKGPVEESTKLQGKPVTASRARSLFKNMKQVADEIKGLLNFKDTTIGVNRILCKESELWIYYNDDVNLNNVMAEVIELLNASGYNYLEFNRLARSDNAIVFLVIFPDTENIMKSRNIEDA